MPLSFDNPPLCLGLQVPATNELRRALQLLLTPQQTHPTQNSFNHCLRAQRPTGIRTSPVGRSRSSSLL